MVIEKGQIFWCGLDPVQGHEQGATRPVVVVSSDAYNGTQSPLVGIVPLTRSPGKNPIHLTLEPAETGLQTASTALTDHARFIDRTRLKGPPLGRLGSVAMENLNRRIARLFGL
jgi:mRNA interferase MazF